jgi:LDH2 family malate/lactate/ureidoglycolate dehydrogenase
MLEPTGGYKGYGLGIMVEILCAGLSGGPFDKDILPMYGTPLSEKRSISHFFMALNISNFVDLDGFRRRMRSLADRIRSLSHRGPSPVMLPGDPEKHIFESRVHEGIPIDDEKYGEFLAISPTFVDAILK